MPLHERTPIRARHTSVIFALLTLVFATAPARAMPVTFSSVVPSSVLTLLMHQVSNDPIHSRSGEDNVKHPWLSPAQFTALLDSLVARGYTFVSLETALNALDPGPRSNTATLPPKPVLLTFDDGYASALTAATPILKEHHAVATMFFEGAATGKLPGRLTLANLRAMRASGVWTLESHGWMGHTPLVVAADGTKSPYWYANLMWRSRDGRLETPIEYDARIRADLHRFRTTFEPLLHTTLDVFAYPSGEFGQNGPLAPGGNPLARLEAGHSNAPDLRPIFLHALASEGYRSAFAVAVPGVVHAASPQDGPYAFPRIGVGADFDPAILDTVASAGIELPEIDHGDTFADCLAIAPVGSGLLVASTQQPEFFSLAENGRDLGNLTIPALLADRPGHPALVAALVPQGDELTVLQQAGWWPGATAFVTRLKLTAATATVLAREPLPSRLRWPVGAVADGHRILAMDDGGRVFDLAHAADGPIFSVAVAAGDIRNGRFAGPALIGERLFVFDRIQRMIDEIDRHGAILARAALGGDIRALSSDGDDLLAVDASSKRRVVRRLRLADK